MLGPTVALFSRLGIVYINGSDGRASYPSAVMAYIQTEHQDSCVRMLDQKCADQVHKDLYSDLKPVFWTKNMVDSFKEYGYGDNSLFQNWLGSPEQNLVVFRLLDVNLAKPKGLSRWLDQVETFFQAVERATGRKREHFIEQIEIEAINFPPAVHLLINPNVREILNSYKK